MVQKEKDNQIIPLSFNWQELGGALGDIGTLLPIAVALILVNGLNATWILVVAGVFYIGSGLYFRIPMPVQPLKVASAVAISMGLPASVLGASGLIIGGILLFLSLTNLINLVVKLFPHAVVRGIQFGVGLMLVKKGIEFAFSKPVFSQGALLSLGQNGFLVGILLAVSAVVIFVLFRFVIFRQIKGFPASLAVLVFGITAGMIFNPIPWMGNAGPAAPGPLLPSSSQFWLAITALVVPQLPLTLGNAVVGTWDTSRTYFGRQAKRVSPKGLATSMGVANIIAGLLGAMPMCHGSGGLTAHYKLGARTGAANLMIGSLLLVLGILFGRGALPILSLIPMSVLGGLLAIVGVYHAMLTRDLSRKRELAVACTVGGLTIILGNLAAGFVAGILLHHLLKLVRP